VARGRDWDLKANHKGTLVQEYEQECRLVTNSKVGGRPTQNLVGLFWRNYFSQKIFEKTIF
jgi:hypothetical protein